MLNPFSSLESELILKIIHPNFSYELHLAMGFSEVVNMVTLITNFVPSAYYESTCTKLVQKSDMFSALMLQNVSYWGFSAMW